MNKSRDIEYIKAFGSHLRELRKAKGLSQEQLANDADIPLSQIGRIERGEINVTISAVKAIAAALSIEPNVLLNFEDLIG